MFACLLLFANPYLKQPLCLKIDRFRIMKSHLMASSKKLKLNVRSFQEFWATDFAFFSRDNQAVCALCCQKVICQTSSTGAARVWYRGTVAPPVPTPSYR